MGHDTMKTDTFFKPGLWTLVIVASFGGWEQGWGQENAVAQDAGRERPYTNNPRYWQYKGQPVLPHGNGTTAQTIQTPYPSSPVVRAMRLDWSTHKRFAQGSDNFQLTWADDDHLYGAWGDVEVLRAKNADGRVSLGAARVEGPWSNYKGYNVWGGKNAENPAQFKGKSWGMICIEGVLYMWVVPDY